MATCPKCGSHLTAHHVCQQTRTARVVDGVVLAGVGAFSALIATAVFDQAAQTESYDPWIMAVGAGIALGTRAVFKTRALRRNSR